MDLQTEKKLFLTNNFFIHGVILVAGIITAYLYLPMIALWFLGYFNIN